MSDQPSIAVEPLGVRDLSAAIELQMQIYPAFLVEDEAAFLSRLRLSASYCLVAKRGETLAGYLLAHGWPRGSPPPVGATLVEGAPAEVLFIHDLAVSPGVRGLGAGRALIRRAFALAARDRLRRAELIAVEGAADFWRRLGFVEEAVSGELAGKIATYGPLARWMTREIAENL